MASQQQHHGHIKWYNYKRGFGFIRDSNTKTDVFVHFTGLKQSLQRHLPREGDKVHFTVCEGEKGPEARHTARTGNQNTTKPYASSQKPLLRTWNMEGKVSACICTAKILAGSDEEDAFIDVEGSDTDQPSSPVEPPPADDEGWITPTKTKKKKNSTSKTPAAEAEPTPQPSHQTEQDRKKAARGTQETMRATVAMLENLKRANPHVILPPINIKIDEEDTALPTQQQEEWTTIRRHTQKNK
ncbi:Y-box-binding protein 2-A [Portunus trituberculatus]|uniref:Y-box-binding protein 2-A n=1 Tax=Portunus trituberculatus TaxID=210409 RepID=A0A5B7J299_PORTR|nr:Y-box-binding protein 2-A [Portunus trituberculatus]